MSLGEECCHKQEEELCLKFIVCLQLSRRWSRCKLIRHDSKRKHDAGGGVPRLENGVSGILD
jgi:hypothetical protein